MQGAFLDDAGVMHIVYFGGDDRDGDIFYSSAPVVSAANAHAWTKPVVIGDQAITPDEAALVGDNGANLYVIYAGTLVGHGVYFVHSADGGESWSEPLPVFLAYSQQLWPSVLELYRDNGGQLHALWSLGNTTGNSESVNYARFDPDSGQWSEPIELAEAIGIREVDTAKIIEFDGELFVIYHDDEPTTRHMLRSQDGGDTWSGPVRLFPHVGSNGAASLVIDSKNTLHMFFGNRVGLPYTNFGSVSGIWHSVWQRDGWSIPYDIIISAPQQARLDPSFANAVVSQGNVTLVTWRQDPGVIARNGVWSTYTSLDTPELPLITPIMNSSLVPSATATTVSVATPVPTLVSNSVLTDGQTENLRLVSESPSWPLFVGAIPVVAFVLLVVVRQTWRDFTRR
jgi:hypothetical protein